MSTSLTTTAPSPFVDSFVALELTVREDDDNDNDNGLSTRPAYQSNSLPAKALSRSLSAAMVSTAAEPTVRSSFVYPRSTESFLNNLHLFCVPARPRAINHLSTTGNINVNSKRRSGQDSYDTTIDTTLPEYPRIHDFVLTDDVGKQRFVTCLTVDTISMGDVDRRSSLMPLILTKDLSSLGSSDSTLFGAKTLQCFCLISRKPLFDTMRTCLSEFVQLSLSNQVNHTTVNSSTGILETFIRSILHEMMMPPEGPLVLAYTLPHTLRTLSFHPPDTKRWMTNDTITMPSIDFSIIPTLKTLSINTILDIFTALLTEQSVFFYSTSLTLLHRTSQTFINLLHPLQWNLVYVPLVPESMHEMIEAPTTFIMGAPSSWVYKHLARTLTTLKANKLSLSPDENKRHLTSLVYVDIDNDTILFDLESPLLTLPRHQQLRKLLQHTLHGNFIEQDKILLSTANRYDQNTSDLYIQHKIRLAFLGWFAETIGADMHIYFDAYGELYIDRWLAAIKPTDRPFMKVLWQTQMFSEFLFNRKPNNEQQRPRDYFDRFSQDYLETPSWASREGKSPFQSQTKSINNQKEDDKFVLSMQLCLNNDKNGSETIDTDATTTKISQTLSPKALPRPPKKRERCRFEPKILEAGNVSVETRQSKFEILLASLNQEISQQTMPTNINSDKLVSLYWTRAKVRELRMSTQSDRECKQNEKDNENDLACITDYVTLSQLVSGSADELSILRAVLMPLSHAKKVVIAKSRILPQELQSCVELEIQHEPEPTSVRSSATTIPGDVNDTMGSSSDSSAIKSADGDTNSEHDFIEEREIAEAGRVESDKLLVDIRTGITNGIVSALAMDSVGLMTNDSYTTTINYSNEQKHPIPVICVDSVSSSNSILEPSVSSKARRDSGKQVALSSLPFLSTILQSSVLPRPLGSSTPPTKPQKYISPTKYKKQNDIALQQHSQLLNPIAITRGYYFRQRHGFIVLNEDVSSKDDQEQINLSVKGPLSTVLDPVEFSRHLLISMITLLKTVSKLVKNPSTGQPLYFILNNVVAMQSLASSTVHQEVKWRAGVLRKADMTQLSFNERLCFFLNIRNLLLIQDYIENSPPLSLYQRLTQTSAGYILDGHAYSLNEITNGVLRAELFTPSILGVPVIPLARFSSRDPRYALRLDKPLPLLNFVLSDGTSRSPRIVAYSLDNLYGQLEQDACEYVRTEFNIVAKRNTVIMPQYFSWYYRDFGNSPADVLVWMHQHLPQSIVSVFLRDHGLVKYDLNVYNRHGSGLTARISKKLTYRFTNNYAFDFTFKLAV